MIKRFTVCVDVCNTPIYFNFIADANLEITSRHNIKCDVINYTPFDDDTRLLVTATIGNMEREFVFNRVIYYEEFADANHKVKENCNA